MSARAFIPVAELAATMPTGATDAAPAAPAPAAPAPALDAPTVPTLPALLDALPTDRWAATDAWTLFGEAEA